MRFNFINDIFMQHKTGGTYAKPIVIPELTALSRILITPQGNRFSIFSMNKPIAISGSHIFAKRFDALGIVMEREFGALN
jgi:hypothetical protein